MPSKSKARPSAVTTHRDRPISPILKTKTTKPRPQADDRIPEGRAICWKCGNRPDEVEACGVCDASGLVDEGEGAFDE